MTPDGYMNEKHFAVIERSLLQISGTRRKLREAAQQIEQDGAEKHLVDALHAADRDLEAAYNRMFQGTYFHVSEEQMEGAGKSVTDDQKSKKPGKKPVEVPEPTDELRLFKAEETADELQK